MKSRRQSWQDFKKAHPNFEKSKRFKADVGPQLEKFERAAEDFYRQVELARKKQAECLAIGKSIAAALKGYGAVVADLKGTDKSIAADFAPWDDFYQDSVSTYALKLSLS
ncbi:MAG: hypothetical protein ACKVQR_21360 [Aquabacterium sp.]